MKHSVQSKVLEKSDKLQPWEKKFGETVEDRIQHLGHDATEYRNSVHLPPVEKEAKHIHEVYIHHLGSEMLRTMFSDEQLHERERAIALKKLSKIGQLLRKRIKVTDFDDGGLNISMEQDWDTSSWNDTLIEAAAEALLYVFYDLSGVSAIERKERAIQMLKKLMDRHPAAVDYIRKNLEMLMGKAASKLIRKGVSGGILNLLYVINSCKEQFYIELCNYNFAGRIIEMLILEAKVAAILIQHSYRARFSKRKLAQQQQRMPHLQGFGTEKEVYYRRLRVINARSAELRYFWRMMHSHHPASLMQLTGGLRGPVHVGPVYLNLCLDILRYLVSDNVKSFAHANREDIVRANGCILLSTYIGTMNNKFAAFSVQVLAEIAKVAESLYPIIESGCIDSVVKFIRYLRTIMGVGVKVVKAKKTEAMSPIVSYLSSLDIITNAALHFAGVFRARENYQCVRSAANGVERTDYRQVLSTMRIKNGITIDDLTPLLCNPLILTELAAIILSTHQLSILTKATYCYLILLSCDGHHLALGEALTNGGKLLLKFLSFLIHDDDSLATTALCIFQQLTCYESSRHALSIVNLPGQLQPLFHRVTSSPSSSSDNSRHSNSNNNTNEKKLYRLLLVMIFVSRQKNWRLYDPEQLFAELNRSDLSSLREVMYVYLLRSIKDECFLGVNGDISRSDLLLLPSFAFLSRAMGKVLINYPYHFLVNCLYRPENPVYYEACPLDETCAICVILQSFIFYKPLLAHSFSPKMILFLSKFLFLCKYLFLGKAMVNRQIVLLFQGIKAAIVFLSEMMAVILHDEEAVVSFLAVLQETELIDQSILFFLNTLQEFQIQKKLQEEEIGSEEERARLFFTLQLQKEIGVCSIKFLTSYARLVNHWHHRSLPVRYLPSSALVTVSVQDIYPAALKIVKMLKNLKRLYQQNLNQELKTVKDNQSGDLKEQFHHHNMAGTLTSFYSNKNITFQFNSYRDEMTFIQDCLCACLAEMTRTKGGAVAALQEWDVQNAMRNHLPPPLSGLVFSSKSNQIPDPANTLNQTQSHHIILPSTLPLTSTNDSTFQFTSTNNSNNTSNASNTNQNTNQNPYPYPRPSTPKKVTIATESNQYHELTSLNNNDNNNDNNNKIAESDFSFNNSPMKGLTINTNTNADLSINTYSSQQTKDNTSSYGKGIQSPHYAHSTNNNNSKKASLTEVMLHEENNADLRLQLMEIPATFFELIAHLCFIEEGKVFCFADGFLRRSLDKLTLIHSLLPTNQTNEVIVHYQQYQQQQRQQTKRMMPSFTQSLSHSHSFLLSSVTSPKNNMNKPSSPSHSSSFIERDEAAVRGNQRAESILSEGKDDDNYYQQIVDFSKHFRASFDQTEAAFTPSSSSFARSNPKQRKTNLTTPQSISSLMNATLPPTELFNWIRRKKDVIACLKIVKNIANYHHTHHGSTNDLILSSSLYAVIEICKDLIKLHLPRSDETILLAYECLAELAKDTFRFHQFMEQNHLLEIVKQELALSIDFPLRGLISAVNMIRHACQGITSHYIVHMIPLLREPLLRISRIYPQLNEEIRSANWILTKSAMIYKSTVDPNYIVSNVQNITQEMEDFFRTGNLQPQSATSQPSLKEEKKKSPALITANPVSSSAMKLPLIDTQPHHHHDHNHLHPATGEYAFCGVGSCGSLRFPDAPGSHGEYERYSEEERKQMLHRLPLLDPAPDSSSLPLSHANTSKAKSQQYIMPLTKMPANEKVLQTTLKTMKGKQGFAEIQKIRVHDVPSAANSPAKEREKRSLSAPPKTIQGAALSSLAFLSPDGRRESVGFDSPIRSISVSELPELKFTRPKLPK